MMEKMGKMMSRTEAANLIFKQFSDSIQNLSADDNFSYAIELVKACNGKIITTGMGKAGIAMRKFASTLCSLGFPACYLHPGEASHGDLGLIGRDDILFVASTSGKTREIMDIVDLSKRQGAWYGKEPGVLQPILKWTTEQKENGIEKRNLQK